MMSKSGVDVIYIDPEGTYCIRLDRNLPKNIKGCVRYDEDGYANVYINARLPYWEWQSVIAHELEHIKRDDPHNYRSIKETEHKHPLFTEYKWPPVPKEGDSEMRLGWDLPF